MGRRRRRRQTARLGDHGGEERGLVDRSGAARRREKEEGKGAVPPRAARSPGSWGQAAGSRAPPRSRSRSNGWRRRRGWGVGGRAATGEEKDRGLRQDEESGGKRVREQADDDLAASARGLQARSRSASRLFPPIF